MDLVTISMLALLVTMFVEVTKGLPLVDRIPTKGWALIVSVVVNFLVIGIEGTVLTVASVCQVILSSLVIAYIAIYGFDTFKELYDRFMKGRDEDLK